MMKRPFPNSVYPAEWDLIAEAVKDRAGWKCIRCQHPHDVASGHVLTVHHLDGDKGNCQWWNLLALCQRCHLKIQGKLRNIDQGFLFEHSDWLKPYLEARTAHLQNHNRRTKCRKADQAGHCA